MAAQTDNETLDPSDQLPVGIDLGTTYSVVAYIDATGRPTTVLNGSGDMLTPSSLLFDDEELIVGREAAKSSVITPEAYAECFKRDMGDMNYHLRVRGVDVPPEVLSGFVLQRLKEDTERRLGQLREVVITVPAFFDETRRKATQDAGRLAGLEVLDIINEPTAAAVAYGYSQGFLDLTKESSTAHRVLVYDLGGGTFDTTILEIEGNRFRAVATDGDVRLGGKDFDERLVNYLAEQFVAAHGVDPRNDPQDAAQLWLDAQEAKHTLSERAKTTIVCFHAGLRARVEVTRQLFEDLTRDLLERTETTTSLLVKEAGFEWSDIERVLLVGGSSRMPMVVDMLQRMTGKEPDRSQSPDEAVAHGASLYCAMLMDQRAGADQNRCELVNVNSHSLGVVAVHRKSSTRQAVTLIPKNTPLPAHKTREFKTAKNDQRSVLVKIVEGESHRPEDCIALGECVIQNLPSGLPKGTPVQVEYSYAANGRIAVSARIPSTRQSAYVDIKRDHARDLSDLDTWRKRLLGQETDRLGSLAAAAAEQEHVDVTDRASVLKRLDLLFTKIGTVAGTGKLPERLAASRQAVIDAQARLKRADDSVQQAELNAQAATGSTERIRANAEVAQAQAAVQRTRSQHDFACLVLGRDCIEAGHHPDGCQKQIDEVNELKKRL